MSSGRRPKMSSTQLLFRPGPTLLLLHRHVAATSRRCTCLLSTSAVNHSREDGVKEAVPMAKREENANFWWRQQIANPGQGLKHKPQSRRKESCFYCLCTSSTTCVNTRYHASHFRTQCQTIPRARRLRGHRLRARHAAHAQDQGAVDSVRGALPNLLPLGHHYKYYVLIFPGTGSL